MKNEFDEKAEVERIEAASCLYRIVQMRISNELTVNNPLPENGRKPNLSNVLYYNYEFVNLADLEYGAMILSPSTKFIYRRVGLDDSLITNFENDRLLSDAVKIASLILVEKYNLVKGAQNKLELIKLSDYITTFVYLNILKNSKEFNYFRYDLNELGLIPHIVKLIGQGIAYEVENQIEQINEEASEWNLAIDKMLENDLNGFGLLNELMDNFPISNLIFHESNYQYLLASIYIISEKLNKLVGKKPAKAFAEYIEMHIIEIMHKYIEILDNLDRYMNDDLKKRSIIHLIANGILGNMKRDILWNEGNSNITLRDPFEKQIYFFDEAGNRFSFYSPLVPFLESDSPSIDLNSILLF